MMFHCDFFRRLFDVQDNLIIGTWLEGNTAVTGLDTNLRISVKRLFLGN